MWALGSPEVDFRTRICVLMTSLSSSTIEDYFCAQARLSFSNTFCLAGSKSMSIGSKKAACLVDRDYSLSLSVLAIESTKYRAP